MTTKHATAEYEALNDAIAELDGPTPCHRDPRFIQDADELGMRDRLEMRGLCRSCPVWGQCADYAQAERPTSGMWAGTYFGRRAVLAS